MQQQNRFEDVFALDSVTINVTNACNLNCSYCFESEKDDSMMSEELIKDIIDKSYRKLDDMRFMVNIFGGEPLLNWPVIKAAILHADQKGYDIKFGITTNLTLLTSDMLDIFDEYDVSLLVSFDGTQEAHDLARCNSYNLVKGNLFKLKIRGLDVLSEIRMTVTPENVDYLHKGIVEIFEMGFDAIVPCVQADTDWDKDSLIVLSSEIEKVMDFYLQEMNNKDSNRNLAIKIVDDYIYTNLEPFQYDARQCAINTPRWCSVGVNGEVMPCHQWHTSKEFKDKFVGNIYGEFSKDIFREPAKFKLQEKCEGCLAMPVCKGGCPTQNFINTGDEQTPTESYCNTCIIIASAVKERIDDILTVENPRSRRLVILIENLKIKKYFDEVLCVEPLDSPDFLIILKNFQDMAEKAGNVLLDSFSKYYTAKLFGTAYLSGEVENG